MRLLALLLACSLSACAAGPSPRSDVGYPVGLSSYEWPSTLVLDALLSAAINDGAVVISVEQLSSGDRVTLGYPPGFWLTAEVVETTPNSAVVELSTDRPMNGDAIAGEFFSALNEQLGLR